MLRLLKSFFSTIGDILAHLLAAWLLVFLTTIILDVITLFFFGHPYPLSRTLLDILFLDFEHLKK